MVDKASMATVTFTERDREVLRELISAYDSLHKIGVSGIAPIDCGGSNGSDHSYRLSKLVRLGYAEHKKRGLDWGESPTNRRGSKVYRPTEAGRQAVKD